MLLLAQASSAQSVANHIKKIDSTIDWIWDGGRSPTGNTSYFYGDQLGFYNADSTNGADRSYGYFLQYTYDMYCNLKGRSPYCLGRSLKVYFSVKGSNEASRMLNVNIAGKSTVSNYFQEIRANMFSGLETIGGKVSISASDRLLIQPKVTKSVRTDFEVITDASGRGNDIWKGEFSQQMLTTLNSEIGNVVSFKQIDKDIVRSATYSSYSQDQTRVAYKNRGSTDRITAVVSSQSARDSYGTAYVEVASDPIFVMNNCANYPKYRALFAAGTERDQKCTGVGIFLHELGHQMGLGHCQAGSSKVCTDNLASTTSGRTFLANHLATKTQAVRAAYDY